jgi:hypothetical protein
MVLSSSKWEFRFANRSPGVFARTRTGVMICAVLLASCLFAFAQEAPSDRSEQNGQATQPQPSLLTPLAQQKKSSPYYPITPRQRLRWLFTNTIGPPHLAGGAISSAFGTFLNRPVEYGPSWGGFSDRFGMRLTGVVTGNAMEASMGMIWGEDPRYFRVPNEPFKARLLSVAKQTFYARRNDASFDPAYARFIGVFGNNFLSNTWRVQSEANNHDAAIRSLEGLGGRMASNAFEEFWPDLKSRVFHRR